MEFVFSRADRETVSVLDAFDVDVGDNSNRDIAAFRFKHAHDLLRRAIAKELTENLFVVLDAMLFHERNEIGRRVSRQRRFGEVRIGRNKVFWLTVQVGKVAAAAAGNQYLFANASGTFEYGHTPAALPRLDGAHQSSCSATENNHIKVVFHD